MEKDRIVLCWKKGVKGKRAQTFFFLPLCIVWRLFSPFFSWSFLFFCFSLAVSLLLLPFPSPLTFSLFFRLHFFSSPFPLALPSSFPLFLFSLVPHPSLLIYPFSFPLPCLSLPSSFPLSLSLSLASPFPLIFPSHFPCPFPLPSLFFSLSLHLLSTFLLLNPTPHTLCPP